jgi:murein DD-endopeptidase MepM/ murein hydrolase activator NlpD
LLAGLFGSSAVPVGADELADAKARQAALAAQIAKQKADIAEIQALQADLGDQIDGTKQQLASINADLTTVRKNIDKQIAQINVVKAQYAALVSQLNDFDAQLDRVTIQEERKTIELAARKALLAERIRQAYDTDRTSMLETFLSGGSFTDVLTEVSYSIDVGEQDKALAEQIVTDQETLAAIHQTVVDTRAATDVVRAETQAQSALLARQLAELKQSQAELQRLETAAKVALEIEQAAFKKLAKNKADLAKALATTQKAQKDLVAKISELIADQYSMGNIPSVYNGSLEWPLQGTVTTEFGCSTYEGYAPGNGCSHFHNGIDIVSPAGCGAPIKAAGDGRIAYIGWNYADGADPAWIVIIAHSQQLQTWYAHMRANGYPGGIHAGSVVQTGQVIGYEDTTGHSTGCHLHWMVEYQGEFRNPRLFV